jgi:hypothetical protein
LWNRRLLPGTSHQQQFGLAILFIYPVNCANGQRENHL